MARVFKPTKNSKPLGLGKQRIAISRLDHQGIGVGFYQKKPVLVEGALAGELCEVNLIKQGKIIKGQLQQVVESSSQRQDPNCEYFGECGGCQLQHQTHHGQLEHKSHQLLFNLKKIGVNHIPELSPALQGSPVGYRRKVRLAVDARNPKQQKLGFKARKDNQVIDIKSCPLMSDPLNDCFENLRQQLTQLGLLQYIGHVTLLDAEPQVCIEINFIREAPQEPLAQMQTWAQEQKYTLMLSHRAHATECALTYQIDGDLKVEFSSQDFIQVNAKINQMMVTQAMQWLSPSKQDRAVDLFAGIGNFTLPLAKRCAVVTGIEGVDDMVQRAQKNAGLNGLDNTQFRTANLFEHFEQWGLDLSPVDIVLMDPARDGASYACEHMNILAPQKILYVSCNPATFSRDAKLLEDSGFSMVKLGIVDMFPQTAHSECMALFERKSPK